MTLKERLKDWTDWEGAEFQLGVLLGLWSDGENAWLEEGAKNTIWSAGGDFLFEMLQQMVKAGVLEYRDQPDHEYRWKGLDA